MQVKKGIIIGENGTYGKVADADIMDNCIIVVSEGRTEVFPLTGEWGDWSEVVAEWNKMYPEGKPLPEPIILPKLPDEIDILMAENLDMRCKLDEQDKLINQLMIASLEA